MRSIGTSGVFFGEVGGGMVWKNRKVNHEILTEIAAPLMGTYISHVEVQIGNELKIFLLLIIPSIFCE